MKVFLGYAREDIEVAKEVAQCLRDLGGTVWRDGDTLVGADDWDAERREGQRDAEFIVHLYSSRIERRRSVAMREIRETLRLLEDESFRSNLALFMRVEDIRLPPELTVRHWVDLFKGNWRDDLEKAYRKRVDQIAGRISSESRKSEIESSDKGSVPKVVELNRETTHAKISHTYLEYPAPDLYWRYVNATIFSSMAKDHFGSQIDFEEIETDSNVSAESYLQAVASEFFRKDDLVSVRTFHHIYFGGAAHPSHAISTLNFLGPDFGLVVIEQLLGANEEVASDLVACCHRKITEGYESMPLASVNDLQENSWNHLRTFNLDREGLTFNFEPYEVLAYAFGPQEVTVPWEVALPLVQENWRGRLRRVIGI